MQERISLRCCTAAAVCNTATYLIYVTRQIITFIRLVFLVIGLSVRIIFIRNDILCSFLRNKWNFGGTVYLIKHACAPENLVG